MFQHTVYVYCIGVRYQHCGPRIGQPILYLVLLKIRFSMHFFFSSSTNPRAEIVCLADPDLHDETKFLFSFSYFLKNLKFPLASFFPDLLQHFHHRILSPISFSLLVTSKLVKKCTISFHEA